MNDQFARTLDNLLVARSYYRQIRNSWGDGFEETIASLALTTIEHSIDQELSKMDISEYIDLLKSE